MARCIGERIISWIEEKIERRLELSINREKTKIVKVLPNRDELTFLGYSFRYVKDRYDRPKHYLNQTPSKKAIESLREKIKGATERGVCNPLAIVIKEVNQITKGWYNYFKLGYPKEACRDINYYLQTRFKIFFENRSQRKCKPFKKKESIYRGLKRLGLKYL